MEGEKTVFERLGGAGAVAALVEDLYERVLSDPQLRPFFEGKDVERIQKMQSEVFCQALGGPLQYTGEPLSTVHHGRGIRMEDFQRFMGHVAESLGRAGLDPEECSRALAALAVEADGIVGRSNVDG